VRRSQVNGDEWKRRGKGGPPAGFAFCHDKMRGHGNEGAGRTRKGVQKFIIVAPRGEKSILTDWNKDTKNGNRACAETGKNGAS